MKIALDQNDLAYGYNLINIYVARKCVSVCAKDGDMGNSIQPARAL